MKLKVFDGVRFVPLPGVVRSGFSYDPLFEVRNTLISDEAKHREFYRKLYSEAIPFDFPTPLSDSLASREFVNLFVRVAEISLESFYSYLLLFNSVSWFYRKNDSIAGFTCYYVSPEIVPVALLERVRWIKNLKTGPHFSYKLVWNFLTEFLQVELGCNRHWRLMDDLLESGLRPCSEVLEDLNVVVVDYVWEPEKFSLDDEKVEVEGVKIKFPPTLKQPDLIWPVTWGLLFIWKTGLEFEPPPYSLDYPEDVEVIEPNYVALARMKDGIYLVAYKQLV